MLLHDNNNNNNNNKPRKVYIEPLREFSWHLSGGSGCARIRICVCKCACGGCTFIPVVSRVFLGSAVGQSPHPAWTSPSSPLLPLLSSSLSFTTLALNSFAIGKFYTDICISFLFSFLSFPGGCRRYVLRGGCHLIIPRSVSLICASFYPPPPLLAAAFPRAGYIPSSLLRVMLSMESIGLLTIVCSYQRLVVSIPFSFPLTIPQSPLLFNYNDELDSSPLRFHEGLKSGALVSPCTI